MQCGHQGFYFVLVLKERTVGSSTCNFQANCSAHPAFKLHLGVLNLLLQKERTEEKGGRPPFKGSPLNIHLNI